MHGTNGVKRSRTTALKWIQKSADAGDCDGLNNLGVYYCLGKAGLERDLEKGAEYTLAAAEKGNYQAMTNIAGFYERGQGVSRDPVKAKYWTQKVAAYDIAGDDGLEAEARFASHMLAHYTYSMFANHDRSQPANDVFSVLSCRMCQERSNTPSTSTLLVGCK
jgi:TPR repeat protein